MCVDHEFYNLHTYTHTHIYIYIRMVLMVNSSHDTPRLAMQSMATATDDGGIGREGKSGLSVTRLGGKGFPRVYGNIGTPELHFHKANSQIILEIRQFWIRDFLGSYCGRGIVEIHM